ncbi:hypothetical protein L218DRAFT_948294 [Marasmius fiardii PR-910]|nr:hypothetical protein L218DRAFT_948294 [Marasmius fiardii PR-910]
MYPSDVAGVRPVPRDSMFLLRASPVQPPATRPYTKTSSFQVGRIYLGFIQLLDRKKNRSNAFYRSRVTRYLDDQYNAAVLSERRMTPNPRRPAGSRGTASLANHKPMEANRSSSLLLATRVLHLEQRSLIYILWSAGPTAVRGGSMRQQMWNTIPSISATSILTRMLLALLPTLPLKDLTTPEKAHPRKKSIELRLLVVYD